MKMVSVRTFDSMTRRLSRGTIDTVLSVATEAELAEYFGGRAKLDPGRVWSGIFRPVLDALDRKTRDEVLGNIERYDDFEVLRFLAGSRALRSSQTGGANDSGVAYLDDFALEDSIRYRVDGHFSRLVQLHVHNVGLIHLNFGSDDRHVGNRHDGAGGGILHARNHGFAHAHG